MKCRIAMKYVVGVMAVAASHVPEYARSELTAASPFTDYAVLQRDMPAPVWGTADAGATVGVSFAGQTKSAVADSNGRWEVLLDPMTASSEPRPLTISCRDHPSLRCSNVLVGDVWICSGQSNMQMGVSGAPDVKALAPSAKHIRTFNVKRTVAFVEQDACEGEWVEQTPDSAVACSFACFLEKAAGVPVGIFLACWGSSSLEAWMPRDMSETTPHFKTMMEEFDADAETRDRIAAILAGAKPWSRADDIFLRRQSNILYNAMMHPLAPYACRGLVWYQGERNTQSMHGMLTDPWYSRNSGMLIYGDVLKQWIQRYRRQWRRPDLHFLIVMLPGYGKTLPGGPQQGAESPTAHSWAWMRESQLKALDLPHTSVANTIDLGHVSNIHPKDKLPIGQRLALLAARDTLGKQAPARGPTLKSVELKDGRLIVHFDHAKGLKTRDGKAPTAFWLADESAQWVKANAELSGEAVVLSSRDLAEPLYVRYAFAGKPRVNLVNEADLPAYPFRTDAFDP